MDDLTVDAAEQATHRRLGVALFNRSWQLLELPERPPEQDDELLHVVHAACNALGRAEPALHHATRCLELVRANAEDHEEWELASAFEVPARAHLAAGDRAEAERHAALARQS